MSAGSEDQPVGVDGTGEHDDQTPGGSGGTLFKRMTSGDPQDQGVKAWVYGGVGALVALVGVGLGVRRWRRRG